MTLNHLSSTVQLRNEYGVAILPSKIEEIPTIRDGAAPKCPGDFFELVPDSGEYFSILPNGSMFYPLFMMGEIESDQYCIDHLLKDDCTLVRNTWYNVNLIS